MGRAEKHCNTWAESPPSKGWFYILISKAWMTGVVNLHWGTGQSEGCDWVGGATAKRADCRVWAERVGAMSKSIKKKRKKKREALGEPSLSAALILSPLQRQALNYHYKPESFSRRRIQPLSLSAAPLSPFVPGLLMIHQGRYKL